MSLVSPLKKTHIVLDLVYTPEEGQDCFDGTHDECQEFVKNQKSAISSYEIVPMTIREIENHPENQQK